MRKASATLLLLVTAVLASCYNEPPSDGELTRKLYDKYHAKAIGQWYLKQDSVLQIRKENNQLYFMNLEQFYDLKPDGSMNGRLRMKVWRVDDSPLESGDKYFIGDYELGGDWLLTHVGYDYLKLRVSPLSENADDISMVESIYRNSMLNLEYITADRMCVRSPLYFTRQTVVLRRVSGEPDSTKP